MKTLPEIKTWLLSPEGQSHPRRSDVELECNLIKMKETHLHNHVLDDSTLTSFLAGEKPEKILMIFEAVEDFAKLNNLPLTEQPDLKTVAGIVKVKKIDEKFIDAFRKLLQSGMQPEHFTINVNMECDHNKEIRRQIELSLEYINNVLLRNEKPI